MSEENTDDVVVDEQSTLLDEALPTLADGEFYVSEGVKGSGDIPDWYKGDKYKSVSAQAEAYTELEKRFGSFTGAPKDGYDLPEGIEKDDALAVELTAFAQESQMSQDGFNKAFELLTAQNGATEEINADAELAKLGDNAGQRIKQVEGFLKNNLDSETYDRLRFAVNSAEVVELVESLVSATSPKKLPIDGAVEPGQVTWADIEKEMFKKNENGQMLRSVDMSHEAKIQRMMKDYGGDRKHNVVMG